MHLAGVSAFDQHYTAAHVNSCRVCGRAFPTGRLLSIHVSESHDAFFQAKAARGFPVYECLVEGCGNAFCNPVARQQHLRDRHHFSSTFSFHKSGQRNWNSRGAKENGRHAIGSCEKGRGLGKGNTTTLSEGVEDARWGGGEGLSSNKHANASSEKQGVMIGREGLVSLEAVPDGVSSMDVENLSVGFSRLSTFNSKMLGVPRAVTFGRRRGQLFDDSVLSTSKHKSHDLRH